MNLLVSIEFLIPTVDEISFSLFSVIRTITLMKERSSEENMGKDMLFKLASFVF